MIGSSRGDNGNSDEIPQSGYVLSLLRVIVGSLFPVTGRRSCSELFGGMGGHGAKAAFRRLFWVAGVLELFGGLLIVLGLFTRPVADIFAAKWLSLISRRMLQGAFGHCKYGRTGRSLLLHLSISFSAGPGSESG